MLWLLLLLGVAVFFVDGPGLIRRKLWREFTAFVVLLALGLGLAAIQVLGVDSRGLGLFAARILRLARSVTGL